MPRKRMDLFQSSTQNFKLKPIKQLMLKLKLMSTVEHHQLMHQSARAKPLISLKLMLPRTQTQMPNQKIQPLTQPPLLLDPMLKMLHLLLRMPRLTRKLELSHNSQMIQSLLISTVKLNPLEDHQEPQSDTVSTNSLLKVETHTLPKRLLRNQLTVSNINQSKVQLLLILQLPQHQNFQKKCNTELMLDKLVSDQRMPVSINSSLLV